MTHAPANILRQLLIDLEAGTDPDEAGNWPIYWDSEPAVPDNCITVYDTQGTQSGRAMPTGEVMGHLGIMVRVRAKDSQTGWEKGQEIQTLLAEEIYDDAVAIGESNYLVHCVSDIGDVLRLGREATSKRSLFTINGQLSVKQL